MRRTLIGMLSSVSTRNPLIRPWGRETHRCQDVASRRRCRDDEALAHRTQPFAPGQEDGGWVVHECLLKRADTIAEVHLVLCKANALERLVDGGIPEAAKIQFTLGIPDLVQPQHRWAADSFREYSVILSR